ncbi:MAG: FimV/HubP family polar landmark protein [Woeseiaceae bacterium]|nr:FimV/HubP family polar landmark protein [Woeseiaceae bacterium]
MPRCLTRISLALVLLISSEVWALGLGEIRLESGLNQPLRAEIELLAATPEELANLRIDLASAETFERYGIDRPFYLQDITFEVVRSGTADGNFVRVRSTSAMREPFLTFLVEASWSRGRLLREYTVLLDPPTFAPQADAAPQVTAPTRPQPSDAGRIDRTPPPAQPQPQVQQPAPRPAAQPPVQPAPSRPAPAAAEPPKPAPVPDDTPYDTRDAGDYYVSRGDTLWGIARDMRPDSRLSMNQTMLAIYEANRDAFNGNINILREGTSLRIPSADEIYNIDRGSANAEVVRQHEAWDGGVTAGTTPSYDYDTTTTDTTTTDTTTDTRPSLQLVPPDEDTIGAGTGEDTDIGYDEEPLSREEQILDRIAEIEAADVPVQESLIDIRNDELAALRQELANIRGEVYEPPVEDVVDDFMDDDPFVDDDEMMADEEDQGLGDDELFPSDFDDIQGEDAAEDTAGEPVAEDTTEADDEPATTSRRTPAPSVMDQVVDFVKTAWWAVIGVVLLLVGGLLFWFMRRGGEPDEPEAWGGALDAEDEYAAGEPDADTTRLKPPSRDEDIVVEESAIVPALDDTIESPTPPPAAEVEVEEAAAATGSFQSLEDTFSSDTAVNLDQSDPIAEADFHMAYGLYDQAADLINGALEVEPQRQDLLTKLCEIYFVWGNRDSFVDAADRLHGVTGGESADWDKIVIMGQQIAGDHDLFAGAGVAGATKAVDLTFESEAEGTGALDMDFGDSGGEADVIDLGGEADVIDLGGGEDEGLDFVFDEATAEAPAIDEETLDFSVTEEMPTVEQPTTEPTVEQPTTEPTIETPTIEQPLGGTDGTAELPSIDDSIAESGMASEQTSEINLDDLGLDLGDLDEAETAALDDLEATGTNEALSEEDIAAVTGKNPQIDPDATGVQPAVDTGLLGEIDLEDDLGATAEMRLAADETGQNPMADPVDDGTDASLEAELLEATGKTQVLPEDLAVETITEDESVLGDEDATMLAPGFGSTEVLGDDDATMLAPGAGDEDFDFAKTEALPPEAFSTDSSLDETGELPAVASTDVDLDLDDLTAALQVSEMGDTVDMPRDDATVEQPRPVPPGETVELAPEDLSADLDEARTMTEVGTKLDLARAYVDMGDPQGARSILQEVLDEGDEAQRQQAQQLLDSLPA